MPHGLRPPATLADIATELGDRLISISTRDASGRRPVDGPVGPREASSLPDDPLFFEYFDGETGAGLGASHQTGWTGLVAKLLEATARRRSTMEPTAGAD